MLNNMYIMLSIFSIAFTIAGILGGILAFRNGFTRTANEVQERVIHALESEITALHLRISDVEDENRKLEQTLLKMFQTLKKRGIAISIDGNVMKISDGNETENVHLHDL